MVNQGKFFLSDYLGKFIKAHNFFIFFIFFMKTFYILSSENIK